MRALNALRWIIQSDAPNIGVRDFAGHIGVSPSTAHRLLSELSQAGFVDQDTESERYSLSLEFLRLAHVSIARMPLESVARAAMRKLTDACNETSLLGVYDRQRQEMMFTAMVESNHTLRYSIDMNKWLPVHVGASGLAIMSFLSETEQRDIIDKTRLMPVTPNSITDKGKLLREFAKIRERGFAITRGQRLPDAVGLAAPVFAAGSQVVGDVNLTIPQSRYDPRNEKGITRLLLRCADEITRSIGGSPPRRA